MKVVIKSLMGRVLTLDAEPGDTVERLKQRLEDKTGEPVQFVRLFY